MPEVPLFSDPQVAYEQARVLLDQKRWADALPWLEQVINAYPDVPELRLAAAQCRERVAFGEPLLREGGLNQARYRYWIQHHEPAMPAASLPLIQNWWELQSDPQGDPQWMPLHGGCVQPADQWPAMGWLVLRHPGCALRAGALQHLEDVLHSEVTSAAVDPHWISADEDCINAQGERCDPWFKPGFTPESFWSRPWLEGFSVWRISWLRTQGMPVPPLDLSQRWEWVLDALSRNPRPWHCPQVLAHWQHGEPKISEAQQRWRALALGAALQRQGEAVMAVEPHASQSGGFQLQWALPAGQRCCVVIPTRDRADLLEACLESVWRSRGLGENALELELLVVDNGSQEEVTEALLRRWQLRLPAQFRVLRDERRFNWSQLNNTAAAHSRSELLLFLNNDIEALEPGWLEAMAAQALRPAIGCVGAVLLYPNRTIQHAGVILGYHGGADHAYTALPYPDPVHRGRPQLLTNWGAVTGACLMVRRNLFEQVGGFDEGLPVEFNDVEFCIRSGQLGYRHVVVPEAVLLHHESQTRDARRSSTHDAALKRMQQLWNVHLESTEPWWPAACSPTWWDGRPRGLEELI